MKPNLQNYDKSNIISQDIKQWLERRHGDKYTSPEIQNEKQIYITLQMNLVALNIGETMLMRVERFDSFESS